MKISPSKMRFTEHSHYAMKCHLIHQDGAGVAIRWDRRNRKQERQNSINLAHAGKIIVDICLFSLLRAGELLIASKQNSEIINVIYSKYFDLFEDADQTVADWQGIEYGKPI